MTVHTDLSCPMMPSMPVQELETCEAAAYRLKAILQYTGEGMVLTNKSGRIELFNEAAERILGTGLIDAPQEDWSNAYGIFLPDGKTPFPSEQLPLARASRGEYVDNIELLIKNPNRPNPIWITVRAAPVTDASGDLQGGVAIFRDITAQRKAEDAVKKSEDLHRRAGELAHVGHYLCDLQTGLIEWSAETFNIFGVTPDDFDPSSDSMFSMVHPDDRNRVELSGQRARRDGTPIDVEYRILREDGRDRIVHSIAEVVKDKSGKPLRIIGTIHDITEQRLAEQKAQRMKSDVEHSGRLSVMGEIAAGIAHELHQPLFAIVNAAGACRRRLEAGDSDPKKLDEMLSVIAAESMRSGKIIGRIKDFVRKREPIRTNHDLNTIVKDTLQIVSLKLESHDIDLESSMADDIPHVSADAVQITQVILNLVLNAIDAMSATNRSARKLKVSTADGGNGYVRVSVADTGAGIALEIAQKLFDQFVTTKPDGLGMGLSISRSIVESYGGTLDCRSEPGWTTVFRFTLPTAANHVSDRRAHGKS